MTITWKEFKDYNQFMDFIIPKIGPGSDYTVDVDFTSGTERFLNGVEDCVRTSRFWKNGKPVALLNVKGIRYDSVKEIDENKQDNIDILFRDIDMRTKEYFPKGIEIISERSFRLKKPYY